MRMPIAWSSFFSSFISLSRAFWRAQQGHAAAGDDAFLDGRLGRVHGVLDAGLLLLHLGLGRRADLDHRHAADQLGQPLLQLLAVVVDVVSSIWLRIWFTRPAMSLALPAPSTIVVLSLSMTIFLARPEVGQLDVLELDAEVLGDAGAAGEDRDVLEHGLAAVAEAREP